MATRSLRPSRRLALAFASLALLPILPTLAPVAVAASNPSAKEEIRFGVEAASQGLWREALFRWERALKNYPDNARLRNNLAVAYESMGQFDQAEAQYKEALQFDPANKEIKDNYTSFQELVKQIRQRQPATGPDAEPNAAAATPSAPGSVPASGATPAPSPAPGSTPAATPTSTPAPAPGATPDAP